MMIKNYDESVEINHKPKLFYIAEHPRKILITGDSGSDKTNGLQMGLLI